MDFHPSLSFALQMDREDPLASFREQYLFPAFEGEKAFYFCGNSLGLQPRGARAFVKKELDRWADLAVKGHFEGEVPWTAFHQAIAGPSETLVGAQPGEVVMMNTLTVNLHLMMATFYRPGRDRYKIIMEAGAFPSDQYAVESQARQHGLDPGDVVVEIAPRPGEHLLRHDDILAAIEREGERVALVLFSGVQYYTGQYFDMASICEAAHRVGAYAGFDLAHAAGNLPMRLHDWGCDFAVWCTYKYLNSGPGALGGVFIHSRHARDTTLPRLAGWWGHDAGRRFLMEKGFEPIASAEGWQLSNAPIFSFAPLRASHALFEEAGMESLRAKSIKLTGFLEYLIHLLVGQGFPYRIISPSDPARRGCQLSLLTGTNGRKVFEHLRTRGVICDWREPNVIRLAPVPMYNTFEEVFRLAEWLGEADLAS